MRRGMMRGVRQQGRRLVAIAALMLAACDSGGFQGMAIDPPREMPTFEFTQTTGSVYRTAPEAGRPMVLFFGYTNCPDVCPTTLADWKRVKATLGAKAAGVRFVFVTVDPDRDTPAAAERYAKQFDADFVGLSGDGPTTARIMEAFGVASAREESPTANGYSVSHSSQVFLVNDRGGLVALYPFGTSWEALAADLDRIL